MADKIDEQLQRRMGRTILQQRQLRGWSQAALAERLGLSMPYTGLLERGERMPAVPVLVLLADVFEIGLDDLLQRKAPTEDRWVQDVVALARQVPDIARPTVMAMLHGVAQSSAAIEVTSSHVRQKEGSAR